MVKYKEFKISDVLCWQPQKEIDPLKISSLNEYKKVKYPFYGQAIANNGIISYESLKDCVLNNKYSKPTILIHSNNQNIVYLETPFYLKDGHGATSVLQSEALNENIALYLIACIKKVISKKFSYNEKATKIALKNTLIKLPITDGGKINYKYMEERIRELEEERIRELEEYLKVSGLDNYNLTEIEQATLNKYKNNQIKYKQFKIGDLFIPDTGNVDIQKKHINNKGNYIITSGISNYGIMGKSDIQAKIFNKNTITVDMFGNVFFRTFKYKMVTHARVFSLEFKLKLLTIEEGIFLTSNLNFLTSMFSYNKMATYDKIKNLNLNLPVNDNNEIDYKFMENFIKAQEKLIIQNLSQWRKKEIDITKQIINS